MPKESNLDAQSILKRRRYEELMAAGRNAFKEGKRQLAHDLWREAATVDPYDEKVWLMLFRVLDKDEDRIVCLENIIAINPMNVQARRRLRAYQEDDEPVIAPPSKTPQVTPKSRGKAQGKRKQGAGAKPRATKTPKAVEATRSPEARTTQKRSGRGAGRTIAIVLLAILLGIVVAVALTIILTPR